MLTRVLGAAALSLVFSSFSSTASAGAMHRISCSVVRFYVARYSASAAESYARSHGATDAQIEAARHCLREAPAQTADAAHWFTR
jgi:hypothetical protein